MKTTNETNDFKVKSLSKRSYYFWLNACKGERSVVSLSLFLTVRVFASKCIEKLKHK